MRVDGIARRPALGRGHSRRRRGRGSTRRRSAGGAEAAAGAHPRSAGSSLPASKPSASAYAAWVAASSSRASSRQAFVTLVAAAWRKLSAAQSATACGVPPAGSGGPPSPEPLPAPEPLLSPAAAAGARGRRCRCRRGCRLPPPLLAPAATLLHVAWRLVGRSAMHPEHDADLEDTAAAGEGCGQCRAGASRAHCGKRATDIDLNIGDCRSECGLSDGTCKREMASVKNPAQHGEPLESFLTSRRHLAEPEILISACPRPASGHKLISSRARSRQPLWRPAADPQAF